MLCFTSFRFSFHIIIAWSLISEWRVRQRSCAIWPTALKVDSMKMKYCSKIYKKIMTKMYFKLQKLVVFKHRQIIVETIECTKTNNDIIDSDEMLLALDSNTRYSQFPSVGSFTSLSIEHWVQVTSGFMSHAIDRLAELLLMSAIWKFWAIPGV